SSGLTAEFQYLDSSDDFYWCPPGFTSWLPYDSIKAIIIANASKIHSIENTWEKLRIDPIDPEYATYTGILESKMEDASGTVSQIRLKETGLVIKRGTEWKLLSG